MGVKPGVPDILVFDMPPSMPGVRGVALELKAGKGRASPVQLEWMRELERRKWVCAVRNGALDAIAWLESLGF